MAQEKIYSSIKFGEFKLVVGLFLTTLFEQLNSFILILKNRDWGFAHFSIGLF
jgi:hypothetical protein